MRGCQVENDSTAVLVAACVSCYKSHAPTHGPESCTVTTDIFGPKAVLKYVARSVCPCWGMFIHSGPWIFLIHHTPSMEFMDV